MPLPDHAQLMTWLHQWSYLAVLAGTLLEGETVMLLGGPAARHGDLFLPAVLCTAASSGWIGDMVLFGLGRRLGAAGPVRGADAGAAGLGLAGVGSSAPCCC